jgi:hypothetical protein
LRLRKAGWDQSFDLNGVDVDVVLDFDAVLFVVFGFVGDAGDAFF